MNRLVHDNHNKLVQKQNNFFIPAVTPLTTTSQRLPPGWYYLGADATVPFVTLIGGDSSQKTFTWGELIQVPEGQMVTVRNESYMKGDIQINSGMDYASKPDRISTLIDVTPNVFSTDINGNTVITFSSIYPIDTRLCRKAYIVFTGNQTGDSSINIDFTYLNKKHSSTFQIPGINLIIPPFTIPGVVPLGMWANTYPLAPMALTDAVMFTVSYIANSMIIDSRMLSILEY